MIIQVLIGPDSVRERGSFAWNELYLYNSKMSNLFIVLGRNLIITWVCVSFMDCLPFKITSQHICPGKMKTRSLPAPRAELGRKRHTAELKLLVQKERFSPHPLLGSPAILVFRTEASQGLRTFMLKPESPRPPRSSWPAAYTTPLHQRESRIDFFFFFFNLFKPYCRITELHIGG